MHKDWKQPAEASEPSAQTERGQTRAEASGPRAHAERGQTPAEPNEGSSRGARAGLRAEASESAGPGHLRAAALEPESELHRRLLWLAIFRVTAVTLLVGTTAVLTFQGGEFLGGRMSVALSGLAVGTNLLQIGVVLLRRPPWLRTLAQVQIAGDVLFASSLVYLTGGGDSLFTFLYLLAIVNGGILLSRQGAWFAAGGAFAAHLAMVLSLQFHWMAGADGLFVKPSAWADLYQALFAHGAAFGLTAVVASYIAGQLEKADERADVAESSLQQLAALHEAIVRSIGSGIMTTDEVLRIDFVNRAGEEILGVRTDELRGQPLQTVFPLLGGNLHEAKSRLEEAWRRSDGSQRILGFAIHPLVGQEGEKLGITAVFQDLTAYRELELRAARSERLATIGELSAGLAHELRNPLASMCSSIELLESEGRTGDEQRLFGILQRETARLDQLVTDFLSFARPAEPHLQGVSLSKTLGEMARIFRADPRAEGLHIRTELAEVKTRVDPAQLLQILWNLLLNAAQASPPGGTISLRCERRQGQIAISVEDEGPGIPAEVMARLFDPFFTTKAQGTGLGLSMVHRIAEAHGGHVDVRSAEGQGSCFTLHLPDEKAA